MYAEHSSVRARAAVLLLTILSVTSARADGSSPHIEIVSFNNNPRCQEWIENIWKAEKWEMHNVPSITIKGMGFSEGEESLEILVGGRIIGKQRINIADQSFTAKVELPSPVQDPKEIEFRIGTDFQRAVPIELKRLHGTVRYFDGRPVARPVIHGTGDVCAVGDEKGNFEIVLWDKVRGIGVFASDYSKNSLECWLYDVSLREDMRLDIRIGKFEVYRLHAWLGDRCIYMHFIPVSFTKTSEGLSAYVKEKKAVTDTVAMTLAKDPDVWNQLWPRLAEDNVRVFLGNEEVSILTFKECDDYCFEVEGKNVSRPCYVLSVPRGKHDWERGEGKVVKVQVQSTARIGGKEIIEKGEAYFFGLVKD